MLNLSMLKDPQQLQKASHIRFLSVAGTGSAIRRTRVVSQAETDKSSASKTASTNATDSSADETSSELVLTPGEKVVVASRLTFWAGVAAFASVCAYYIIRELVPT
jgi:hypothetical protein